MMPLPIRRCRPVSLVLPLLAMLLALLPARVPTSSAAQATPNPDTVTIPGTIQSQVGCPGDWQPNCDKTYLIYDSVGDVWTATFDLPAGSYEYKVAINDSWAENYGLNGVRNGPNIPLSLSAPASVTFIYDHKTNWVADSQNALIPTVVGDFQSEIGCAADDVADCLRTWMQDPDGDGTYGFVTTEIPAGTYTARVALNLNAAELYGEGGVLGGPAATFTVKADGDEIYIGFDAASKELTISTEGAPRGSLSSARAYWVAKDTIVWNVTGSPRYSYKLHYDPEAALKLEPGKIVGGQTIDLTFSPAGAGAALEKFPHLAGFSALKLPPDSLDLLSEILKGQVAISTYNEQGRMLDATSLQIPGVLDDLYRYDGPLGVTFEGDTPTLRVWAPTARSVTLHRFADSNPSTTSTTAPMTLDPATGVWSISGSADWKNQYYLYEVEVYVPSTSQIERNLVTDPYSFSLAQNSTRSQIVDLNDAELKPAGWDTLAKPELAAFEDIVIYELHVRDFSIGDPTVPEEWRGTFKAFTQVDSSGMLHLRSLAQAGLTHIHLLPAFDIATIEEDKAQREEPDTAQLASFPPDSSEQQALINPIRDRDGFNWGYDPFHFTVPEGSYATNSDGPTRIVEFREMVQALNENGLRVVMDVVYNHTNASGQSARSVFDRIVPGYYHRLNDEGLVERSTCCENTASEHAMMEKFMIDSVLTWVKEYKVDGFRFDLMGHHMKSNMVKLREALDALTLERDGVDGKQVYVYGEGWNFGEVADNQRGVNAVQLNMGGTGIGTFNDRLRDGARGGNPFGDPREQGFISGLWFEPNQFDQGTPDEQKERLLLYMDWIRIGLAGNLKDYALVNRLGDTVTGEKVLYNRRPTGYTLDPQEHIVYASAHDNETLFDAVQLKAPASATLEDRVRMNNLGISLVALSQGVPFFHAGDDMLRSKSLDRNSYNSGDWFNRIDWTGQSSNFGVGLPPAGDNEGNWPLMQPLLANPALKPGSTEIGQAMTHFREMLQIRKSSKLFRLESGADIAARLKFLNTGPEQTPGLIVMQLDDTVGEDLDPNYDQIVVLFNGSNVEQSFATESLQGATLVLHPVQLNGQDAVVKTARFDATAGSFTIPARTTAVFVGTVGAQPAPTVEATTAPAEPTTAPTVAPTTPAVTPSPVPAAPASGGFPVVWVALAVVVLGLAVVGFILLRRRS